MTNANAKLNAAQRCNDADHAAHEGIVAADRIHRRLERIQAWARYAAHAAAYHEEMCAAASLLARCELTRGELARGVERVNERDAHDDQRTRAYRSMVRCRAAAARGER